MKPIHILVLILLTTFTLTTNTQDLRNEEDKGESNKLEKLKDYLKNFNGYPETEYASIKNDLLKILEEENLNRDIYDDISLFRLRLGITKEKRITTETFIKYLEEAKKLIKKHNELKAIQENKE